MTSSEALALLRNGEPIAIDQDERQGKIMRRIGALEVWAKPLAGRAVAVAWFRRGLPADTALAGQQDARRLVGQNAKPGANYFPIDAHGAGLLRVDPG